MIDYRVGEIKMLTADLKEAMDKQGQLKEELKPPKERLIESICKLQEASDRNIEVKRHIDVKTVEIKHNQEEAEKLRS